MDAARCMLDGDPYHRNMSFAGMEVMVLSCAVAVSTGDSSGDGCAREVVLEC